MRNRSGFPARADLGTTKRKPLTPRQRLALFEKHHGICVVCNQQIRAGSKWIDEHLRPLGLSGSNDPDNRGPAHVKCAEIKTRREDMPRISKAKAQKRAALGIKAAPVRPLHSRGFAKAEKAEKAAKIDKNALVSLPRRELFR